MTLLELYNLKLNEYKKTGLREKPWKLLAMLLLSEKDKFEPLRETRGDFYKKYKEQIDEKIKKVERDFNFVYQDIVDYIERTHVCDDYEKQRIWYVFEDGFGVLNWALLYRKEKTGEEIYAEYYKSDDLIRSYNIEERLAANKINSTPLGNLLDKILENPNEFFEKIEEELTVEERLFILSELKNKSCMSCTNGCCDVPSYEKVGVDEFGKPEGSECIGWFNSRLIGRSKVLRKTDINELYLQCNSHGMVVDVNVERLVYAMTLDENTGEYEYDYVVDKSFTHGITNLNPSDMIKVSVEEITYSSTRRITYKLLGIDEGFFKFSLCGMVG